MKIIDKNKDYYDYIQFEYVDDTFTFDRRDSFILTKGGICNYTYLGRRIWMKTDFYLVLQVCNSFWALKLNPIEKNDIQITKYNLELIASFKDYNEKREMLKLSLIEANHVETKEEYLQMFKNKKYRIFHVFDKAIIDRGDYKFKEERHIPILRETGIPSVIDGHEIYLALEEYFSAEKTASERTDPIGMTNNDKITTHGFDLISSFRR